MSLEQEIANLTKAVEGLATLLVQVGERQFNQPAAAPAEVEKPAKGKRTTKKEEAKPIEETKPPVDDLGDLDAELNAAPESTESVDDDLGLDLDEPAAPEVDAQALKGKLSELGKKKGRETVLNLLKKYKASTFDAIQKSDYSKIYAEADKALV